MMALLSALCERSDYKLVHATVRSYSFNPLWTMIQQFFRKNQTRTTFQSPELEDIPQTLCLYVHFEAVSLIHSAPQRNAETLRKVLRLFRSVMWSRSTLVPFYLQVSLYFFLFLDFIAISHCVFNNENNYSTRACWISNNYNHFGAYAPRCLSIISSAPSLYANLRVPTRVYAFEGGAILSKNSTFVFFDGAACPHLRSPSPIMAPGCTQKKTTGNKQRTHVHNFNFIYFCFSQLLWTPCGANSKTSITGVRENGPEWRENPSQGGRRRGGRGVVGEKNK